MTFFGWVKILRPIYRHENRCLKQQDPQSCDGHCVWTFREVFTYWGPIALLNSLIKVSIAPRHPQDLYRVDAGIVKHLAK